MASPSFDRLEGLVLEGRYRLARRVGEGGFGVVYRGEVAGSPMPVAVKLLRLPEEASASERATLLQKFELEAQVLRRLRHPNIVSALDGGLVVIGGVRTAYLVLEWCEGDTLKRRLEATRGQRPGAREAWQLMRPVVEAVAHAHAQGVVHRDLKPANVMLVPEPSGPSGQSSGARLVPRVIDFGIAKAMSPDAAVGSGDTMTTTIARAFTPAYAAPEQVVGLRTGPWTDVHALALMLVELLVGQQAYAPNEERFAIISPTRPTPKTFDVDVGPWEAVLSKALALQPNDRVPSASSLLAALDATLDAADAVTRSRVGAPLPAAPTRGPIEASSAQVTTAPRGGPPAGARRSVGLLLAGLGGALLALVGVVVALVVVVQRSARDDTREREPDPRPSTPRSSAPPVAVAPSARASSPKPLFSSANAMLSVLPPGPLQDLARPLTLLDPPAGAAPSDVFRPVRLRDLTPDMVLARARAAGFGANMGHPTDDAETVIIVASGQYVPCTLRRNTDPQSDKLTRAGNMSSPIIYESEGARSLVMLNAPAALLDDIARKVFVGVTPTPRRIDPRL
jgi:serine/threonine protein kinase